MYSRQRINVLIIDDNETSLEILNHHLMKAGFCNIEKIQSSKEALKYIDTQRPELIFTDIIMPDISGYDLIKAVREKYENYHPIMIAVTGLNIAEERLKIFEYGADELILKPISRLEIEARVGKLLERKTLINELQAYKERTSLALDNARLLLESLVPNQEMFDSIHQNQRLLISGHYQPTHEIGGDLWGIKPISTNKVAIYIFDFMGHGIAAALHAFRFQNIVETIITDHDYMPDYVMNELNQRLCRILPRGHLATMFYAVLDTKSHQLHYSCACSPLPIILQRGAKEIDILDGSGLPLGVEANYSYISHTTSLDAHSTLLLYSDALTETSKRNDSTFLSEQEIAAMMQSQLKEISSNSHDNLISELVGSIRPDIHDDLTICLLSRAA